MKQSREGPRDAAARTIARVRLAGSKSPVACALVNDRSSGEWSCLQPRECEEQIIRTMMATWSGELAIRVRTRKKAERKRSELQ